MESVIKPMLNFRNQIKLYHWKTYSYARHKTTDKFLELFDEKVDRFVETMMGSRDLNVKDKFKLDFINVTDKSAVEYVKDFRSWVKDNLTELIEEDETDLLNIRDEILGDLNRMLYLLRLS